MRFLVIAALVLVASCSSNEQPLVAPSGSAGVVTPAPTVAGVATFLAPNFTFVLRQNDANGKFFFDPHTIQAPKGSRATIEIHNVGSVKHNLTIASLHIDTDVDPGKSATVTVPLGDVPSVPFYCKYHKASGMAGVFNLS